MPKRSTRSFGYKCGWFAIKSRSMARVAKQFLARPTEIAWDAGCDEAYRAGRFVTPPTDGWVLVASTEYLQSVDEITRDLAKLSRTFGEAQFFTTDRVVGLLGFARARDGKVQRAYFEVDGRTEVDEGKATADERTAFPDGREEGGLMELATRWSVDPTQISRHRTGLVSAPPPTPEPVPPRAPRRSRVEVGKPAPAFELPVAGSRAKRVQLAKYAGKPVVLFFYPGCTSKLWISATNFATALERARQQLAKHDAVVLGICDDTNEANRTRHELEVEFPCLHDRSRATIDAYGAWGESRSASYEVETGTVQSLVLVGRDGNVAEIERHASFVDPVLAGLLLDNLVASVKALPKPSTVRRRRR